MTTIELGEIDSTPDPGPATEFGHRVGRRAAIALIVLTCLFATTGSARGDPPGVRPLWRVPIAESDGTTLGSDAAYLQRATAGRSVLTAYDLATGRVRWETTVDGTLGYTQLAEAAGLLLLPTDAQVAARTGDVRYARFSKETTAFDIRTGEARWSAAGEPMMVDGRTALMVDYAGEGVYARLRLIGLEPAAARLIWSRDTPDVESLVLVVAGRRTDKIVTVSRDGLVSVVRFADGALLASARIPWRTPDPEHGEFNDLAPAGDHLVVNHAGEYDSDLTVYRLDTLSRAWEADVGRGYAFPCGTGVCFNDSGTVTAYDLDSGRQRWQRDGIDSSWAAGDDRLVGQRPGLGQQLFDAATGAPVGAIGEGETVWTTEPGGALLVLRATHDPPGQTSITRWDLATGRRELLGAVSSLSVNRCQLVPHYLGCFQDHEFVVTAVA
jgi:outer membrane protein assembly factor BamB